MLLRTPIIPNSQLMVIADKNEDPDLWVVTLFTEYTDFFFVLMITTALMLMILGIAVAIMYKKERDAEAKPISF